jgi:hypothetical protein
LGQRDHLGDRLGVQLRTGEPGGVRRRERRRGNSQQNAVSVEHQDISAAGAGAEGAEGDAEPATMERVAELLDGHLLDGITSVVEGGIKLFDPSTTSTITR